MSGLRALTMPSRRSQVTLLALCALAVMSLALHTDRATSTSPRPPLSVLTGPVDSLAGVPQVTAYDDVSPAAAHLASTRTDEQVWLAAGKTSYCLYVQVRSTGQGAQACGDLADAIDGNAALTMTGAGKDPLVRVIGVVPDGVKSVRVASDRGSTAIAVVDNVFVAHTDASAGAVSFVLGDGVTTTPLIVEK
ncbi:MAG TPA: hypothetical protein VGO80_19385 [Solirubrobacteraceae bacterium]|jgi:hypothetical protein|nr:hypothetical protein [Solirubrobacteraceae bacterium]